MLAPSIAQRFDFLEVEMPFTGSTAIAHVLLRPENLRLCSFDEEEDEDFEFLPGEEQLVWDSIEFDVVTPAQTRTMIWGLASLAESSPQEIVKFVNTWGLLDFGEDSNFHEAHKKAWQTIENFQEQAQQLFGMLDVFAASQDDRLVSEMTLGFLRNGEETPFYSERVQAYFDSITDENGKRRDEKPPQYVIDEIRLSGEDRHQMTIERQNENWRRRRAAGEGIELQNELMLACLSEWTFPLDQVAVWDKRGRRIESIARGGREIVGDYLASLFTAPILDVYTCSICSRFFGFDEDAVSRRPRRGAARFCSQECREIGKRRANLASWHRNKGKWPLAEGQQNG